MLQTDKPSREPRVAHCPDGEAAFLPEEGFAEGVTDPPTHKPTWSPTGGPTGEPTKVTGCTLCQQHSCQEIEDLLHDKSVEHEIFHKKQIAFGYDEGVVTFADTIGACVFCDEGDSSDPASCIMSEPWKTTKHWPVCDPICESTACSSLETMAFGRFVHDVRTEFNSAASYAERFTAMMCFACDPAVFKCSSAVTVRDMESQKRGSAAVSLVEEGAVSLVEEGPRHRPLLLLAEGGFHSLSEAEKAVDPGAVDITPRTRWLHSGGMVALVSVVTLVSVMLLVGSARHYRRAQRHLSMTTSQLREIIGWRPDTMPTIRVFQQAHQQPLATPVTATAL
jgi:hypothetical protein